MLADPPMAPPGRQGRAHPAHGPSHVPRHGLARCAGVVAPALPAVAHRRQLLGGLVGASLSGGGLLGTMLGITPARTAAAPAWVEASAAQKVQPALERPAVATAQGERAVLQAVAGAGRRLVAVGERGLVLLSDDAGQHWRQAPCPVSVGLTALRFADARHGVAVGHGGVVLLSRDGGEHWVKVLDGLRIAQLERAAAQASTNPAALQSAERLVADGPDKPLLDVQMLDAQRLLVVGAYGLALYSPDGGTTWQSWRQRLDNPKELHLYALRQRGNELLIAGEQGLLLHSRDAGASFTRLASPYKGSFFTAELPPDGSWVAAGLRGNLWRSTDGGVGWQAVNVPVPASITASALLPGGALLLASQAGVVLAVAPGADQAVPLRLPPLPPLTALLPLSAAGALGTPNSSATPAAGMDSSVGDLLVLSVQGLRRLAAAVSHSFLATRAAAS